MKYRWMVSGRGTRFSRLRYAEGGRLKLTASERKRIEMESRAVLVRGTAEISESLRVTPIGRLSASELRPDLAPA
jgi:hypothetical protein